MASHKVNYGKTCTFSPPKKKDEWGEEILYSVMSLGTSVMIPTPFLWTIMSLLGGNLICAFGPWTCMQSKRSNKAHKNQFKTCSRASNMGRGFYWLSCGPWTCMNMYETNSLTSFLDVWYLIHIQGPNAQMRFFPPSDDVYSILQCKYAAELWTKIVEFQNEGLFWVKTNKQKAFHCSTLYYLANRILRHNKYSQ